MTRRGYDDTALIAEVESLIGLSLVCMIIGGVGALGTMAWLEFRTKPLRRLKVKEAVGYWDVRRYVLTDKALYALTPEGRSVRIQWIVTDILRGVRTNGDGDYEIQAEGSVITLRALPDAEVLVRRLGFRLESATTVELAFA